MSAETIPSEVATDLDCIRWYVECLDAVAFKRRAVAGLAEAEGSYNAAMKRLADRSTRPAEPAAPVAEAGDGEVVGWFCLDLAAGGVKGFTFSESLAKQRDGYRYLGQLAWEVCPVVRLSTLEAERARADELRRLLTASGRCVDDLTARLDAFEHAQEKARDEGFNHALSILEDALGSPTYYAADGSETWEGDTRGTIYNLLRASGVWRGDDDMLVTKDRDFWKERFQVESRSRIEAEQRAADALARAEKAEGALETAQSHLTAIFGIETHLLHVGYDEGPGGGNFVYAEVIRTDDLAFIAARASREAQPATDGGDNG